MTQTTIARAKLEPAYRSHSALRLRRTPESMTRSTSTRWIGSRDRRSVRSPLARHDAARTADLLRVLLAKEEHRWPDRKLRLAERWRAGLER
jgi:hypothetical protein